MLPLCHTIGYQAADEFPELTVTFVAVPEKVGALTVPGKELLPLPSRRVSVLVTLAKTPVY